MDQGWKRLPLLLVVLFWRNADGLKSGAYSDAHRGWGQPSDARSHHAVQSSMSEVHVTRTLPVEEVGSRLFPAKPLKSKSKWNLPQFVKGGSSSYPSMSHAQTAPSSSVSVSLPLSRNQQSSSSLAFSGSTVPGVAGGLRLETQYAASGSGPVSTLRESSSYPAQLGVSGQSTSDALHVSSSQETQSAFSQSTSVLSSQKQYSAASQVSSGAQLGASTGLLPQRMSSSFSGSVQSPGTTSQFALGSPSSYPALSQSSPQGVASQSSSQKRLTSIYQVSSEAQLGASTGVHPQRMSSSSSGSVQSPGTTSLSAPGSPSSYPGLSQSSPQGVASQSSSQKRLTSIYQMSSGAQLGASTGVHPQRMSSSSSGSVQSPGTTSQFALGSSPYAASVSLSSPQAGPSTVPGPQKPLTSTYTGSSGTQAGSSTLFTLHGSPAYGSRQPQGTTSLSAPGSPSSYPGLSQSSPKGVASQSSSQKRLTSIYQVSSGAQLGASTGVRPQRMSSSSSGSVQSPGTTSQFALGSSPYAASVSLSSPQAGPSTVPGPQKQLTSTYTGSSGTQAGSSTPFTLHGPPAYGGSSQLQDMSHYAASSPYGSLYCKCSLSPQGVDHPSTVQSSQKQFTSSYGTQSGSSPFTLQGSVTFDGSQPQGVASQSVRGSLKQLPSTFVGSSGTQAGSSTAILRGGTTYGGSSKPQDTSEFVPGSQSSYASVSWSSPQDVAGSGTALSQKQFISTFTGTSGKPV
ncbi:mucin-19-like [Carassius carassius]|uniref:mucin-19-like n=1 Tax=Carassius carassius TaxID=217509 RepID=UPI00286847B8|nr:mucin-19-like [Carassius carassius]